MFDKKGGKFGIFDHLISYQISFAGHKRLTRNLHIKNSKVNPYLNNLFAGCLKNNIKQNVKQRTQWLVHKFFVF